MLGLYLKYKMQTINCLCKKLHKQKKAICHLQHKIKEIQKDISELDTSLQTEIDTLQTEIDGLVVTTIALQTQIGALQTTTTALQTTTSDMEAEIDVLQIQCEQITSDPVLNFTQILSSMPSQNQIARNENSKDLVQNGASASLKTSCFTNFDAPSAAISENALSTNTDPETGITTVVSSSSNIVAGTLETDIIFSSSINKSLGDELISTNGAQIGMLCGFGPPNVSINAHTNANGTSINLYANGIFLETSVLEEDFNRILFDNNGLQIITNKLSVFGNVPVVQQVAPPVDTSNLQQQITSIVQSLLSYGLLKE